jgi:hypothetical protein
MKQVTHFFVTKPQFYSLFDEFKLIKCLEKFSPAFSSFYRKFRRSHEMFTEAKQKSEDVLPSENLAEGSICSAETLNISMFQLNS